MSESYEYKGYTIKIVPDDDPQNPREDTDPVGTMVCFHGRYNLGDKHDYKQNQFGSWSELEQQILRDHPGAIVLPLYLYDHSGITISTAPFSCLWDSGQIGWIFCTKEKAVEEWGKKICTAKVRAKAEKYLEGEVKVYDQYLTGDVYGYQIYDGDGGLDSCWGFFGEEYCKEAAEGSADWYAGERDCLATLAANKILSGGAL
jgi:hypothetical protein